MRDYYVFKTEAEGQACCDALNRNPALPCVGFINGQPAPDNQKTVKWQDHPVELLSGEWAVCRVPTARLDAMNVPTAERQAFISVFGQDIRTLESSDFVQPEEEI